MQEAQALDTYHEMQEQKHQEKQFTSRHFYTLRCAGLRRQGRGRNALYGANKFQVVGRLARAHACEVQCACWRGAAR